MAEENVSILRVDTGEAVKSVNDLKENIKLLKGSLGDLEIGSQAYQDTLDELKVNQNALKDAMYATTGTMKDVAAAATGASKSYNSLVHQMAALKEEWRATNDIARRNELGQQIAEINAQLKEMDASVGNFSRNVGNYESGVVPLVEKFEGIKSKSTCQRFLLTTFIHRTMWQSQRIHGKQSTPDSRSQEL